MVILNQASQELYRREADEVYPSLTALWGHCRSRKENSRDLWISPETLQVRPGAEHRLSVDAGVDGELQLNDWSFGQLCRLAGVERRTINRLTTDTASKVFEETLPRGRKPYQVYAEGDKIRSIHGAAYTRLYDAELMEAIRDFKADFEPPPKGTNGGTGLYCGEQDMFCFLIDPTGWVEINGEAFAPGFFLWNSEVGRRAVGISTFWFQAVCQNHLVWDAIEVVEFKRKHTANVHEALTHVQRMIETLIEKRDERRDGFSKMVTQAMEMRLGNDSEEVLKELRKHGVNPQLAKRAIEHARPNGPLTLFTIVDALTRFAHDKKFIGDRTAADQVASKLLALAV